MCILCWRSRQHARPWGRALGRILATRTAATVGRRSGGSTGRQERHRGARFSVPRARRASASRRASSRASASALSYAATTAATCFFAACLASRRTCALARDLAARASLARVAAAAAAACASSLAARVAALVRARDALRLARRLRTGGVGGARRGRRGRGSCGWGPRLGRCALGRRATRAGAKCLGTLIEPEWSRTWGRDLGCCPRGRRSSRTGAKCLGGHSGLGWRAGNEGLGREKTCEGGREEARQVRCRNRLGARRKQAREVARKAAGQIWLRSRNRRGRDTCDTVRADRAGIVNARAARVVGAGARAVRPRARASAGGTGRRCGREKGGRQGATPVSGAVQGRLNSDQAVRVDGDSVQAARVLEECALASSAVARSLSARAGDGAGGIGRRGVGSFVLGVGVVAEESVPGGDIHAAE